MAAATARRIGNERCVQGSLRGLGLGREGPRESRTPRFDVEGGVVSRSSRMVACPFSRRSSINRGAGDRTYAAPGGAAITVAGLCRNCTGFATTRRRFVIGRSVAQRVPDRRDRDAWSPDKPQVSAACDDPRLALLPPQPVPPEEVSSDESAPLDRRLGSAVARRCSPSPSSWPHARPGPPVRGRSATCADPRASVPQRPHVRAARRRPCEVARPRGAAWYRLDPILTPRADSTASDWSSAEWDDRGGFGLAARCRIVRVGAVRRADPRRQRRRPSLHRPDRRRRRGAARSSSTRVAT